VSATVQQLIYSFDSLSEADKHEAAVEILRRWGGSLEGDLSETALTDIADQLFQQLDSEESGHARS
jgi:hypothetical protein